MELHSGSLQPLILTCVLKAINGLYAQNKITHAFHHNLEQQTFVTAVFWSFTQPTIDVIVTQGEGLPFILTNV